MRQGAGPETQLQYAMRLPSGDQSGLNSFASPPPHHLARLPPSASIGQCRPRVERSAALRPHTVSGGTSLRFYRPEIAALRTCWKGSPRIQWNLSASAPAIRVDRTPAPLRVRPPDLQMQMRRCCTAGLTRKADGLADVHPLTFLGVNAAEVIVANQVAFPRAIAPMEASVKDHPLDRRCARDIVGRTGWTPSAFWLHFITRQANPAIRRGEKRGALRHIPIRGGVSVVPDCGASFSPPGHHGAVPCLGWVLVVETVEDVECPRKWPVQESVDATRIGCEGSGRERAGSLGWRAGSCGRCLARLRGCIQFGRWHEGRGGLSYSGDQGHVGGRRAPPLTPSWLDNPAGCQQQPDHNGGG